MILRNVSFHYACDQSGLRNFDGKGYPYHEFLYWLGLGFEGSSFVAKTTTRLSRRGKEYGESGNMPLRADGMTPAEFKPKCIHVSARSFLQGAAINAVGLSGPGISALLNLGIWQEYPEPFMISVMSVAGTREERVAEIVGMAIEIANHRDFGFRSPFGIQLNMSCPNVEHAQTVDDVVSETKRSLVALREIGDDVPLVVKINALFPIEAAGQMCEDSNCDGLCNSNTIPWADVPEKERIRLFGTSDSPLKDLGGGGVSGCYLLPLVLSWVRRARWAGIKKPIIAGGGILKTDDVDRLAEAGASGIAVGSAAFLRPWRVQTIINRANELGQKGRFWRTVR